VGSSSTNEVAAAGLGGIMAYKGVWCQWEYDCDREAQPARE